MSSESPSPFPNSQRQPTWSFRIQNFATPQTYAAKPPITAKAQQPVVASTPSASGSSAPGESARLNVKVIAPVSWPRKRRRLTKEEEETRDTIADAVQVNLNADHAMVLYPDIDTPFADELDIIKRLLPFHVYQQPRHDLDFQRKIKGKEKVSETDLLREEIKETKLALECHKRFRALEKRMKRARMKPGQHINPLDQSILLERLSLESEQYESTILDQELASTRSELDKVLRARRAAKASAERSAATVTTPQVSNSYYNYTTPTFSTSMTTNYPNYYSSYTYPYSTQSHLPGAPYVPPTYTTNSTPANTSKTGGTNNAQSTVPTPTTTSIRPPPVAIPLQLPVTSLPALQALGILPIPKASLPPPSEPQPAAVLLGSTNNGSMLSLEINAAQLQAPQMSGLAVLLSSLVKMSGGQNGSAQAGPAQGMAKSTVAGASKESPAA